MKSSKIPMKKLAFNLQRSQKMMKNLKKIPFVRWRLLKKTSNCIVNGRLSGGEWPRISHSFFFRSKNFVLQVSKVS
jgi:hypothetical protein